MASRFESGYAVWLTRTIKNQRFDSEEKVFHRWSRKIWARELTQIHLSGRAATKANQPRKNA
jgi:hypothetical protein